MAGRARADAGDQGGPACRLLPLETADGPHNMAADEILLEAAAAGTASLRFYTWSEATLSLGYFQAEGSRRTGAASPRVLELPWVRRLTGGGALIHDHEITYALALPAGSPWHDGESWPCRMHGIIAAALETLGVPVATCAGPALGRIGGLLCFQHLGPGDLLLEDRKVVGSAQRRRRAALLQHGSILLARSPFAPELPGIEELAGVSFPPERIGDGIRQEFQRQTGWTMDCQEWTESERQEIEKLSVGRYCQDSWNRKR